MNLSSMIVSCDWQEVSVLECILGSLHIGVEVEAEPERAWDRLAKSKVDAVIVDCDADGTHGFMRRLQTTPNKSAPVVIASGSSGRSALEAMGAAFVVEKPISVERAVHTLSAARNMILNGRLRYHRQTLSLPVAITLESKRCIKGRITNLSQGGARVQIKQQIPGDQSVKLKFALPQKRAQLIAMGKVTWCDEQGDAGIQFADISYKTRKELQLWLEQQYFGSPVA